MAAKPKTAMSAAPVLCRDCELQGEITIGNKTVIHPKAQILAEGGPIFIGESNLIEEQVVIRNRKLQEAGDTIHPMIIGNNNVFEVGCYVESLQIGDNNVLESKSQVGRHTTLTSGCVIGAMCNVTSNEVIPENTVIFGSKCERRLQAEKSAPQTLQLDFLTKILPNYHYLKKIPKPEQPKI